MNPESFTYNGVTVGYSEEQKAIILADQNLITQLKNQLIAHQNEYNRQEGLVNDAMSHLNNDCNKLSGFGGNSSPRQKCINHWNSQWETARAAQTTISGYITTNASQQTSAVKKLNDDITTIQNDIKLQIQTQIANTVAATAAANNQTAISTAPAVVAANANAVQTTLANEAAAAKLKQEQNIKIATFTLIAIVIIVIGISLFRRVS